MNVRSEFPLCVVLIATRNGALFLEDQLKSIRSQSGVSVRLLVSDDHSTDKTMEIIQEAKQYLPIQCLPRTKDETSNSNKNFLSLLASADIGNAQFVALSDQDDVWDNDKLSRAISRLNELGADIYSSDVIAFWPNGRKKVIKKSYPFKLYDHLFGSPGPGCTFVFTRSAFLAVQEWIKRNCAALSALWIHDWSIYCFAREQGLKWTIDDVPKMHYRQHLSNAMGANIGVRSWLQRFRKVLNGEYRFNIIALAELTHAFPAGVIALRRLTWSDRLWLIARAKEFRRSRIEVIALQIMLLIMPRHSVPAAFIPSESL